MIPTTPSKGKQPETEPKTPTASRTLDMSGINSTPQSIGTAPVGGEAFPTIGATTKKVSPWLLIDLQRMENVHTDVFLKYLLQQCREENAPPMSGDEQLKECLEIFTEMANSDATFCSGISEDNIRTILKNYLDQAPEAKRYKPFNKATNSSLYKLASTKIPGYKDVSNPRSPLVSQVFAGKQIIQQHDSDALARRSPDFLFVDLCNAVESHIVKSGTNAKKPGKGEGTPPDSLKEDLPPLCKDSEDAQKILKTWGAEKANKRPASVSERPILPLHWRHTYGVAEMKYSKAKNAMPVEVPQRYTPTLHFEPSEEVYLSIGQFRTRDALDAGICVAPVEEVEAMSLNAVSSDTTLNLVSSTATSSSSRSLKRRADDLDPQGLVHSVKKPKFGATESVVVSGKDQDPILQLGKYVAEIFSHSCTITFVIGMIVHNDYVHLFYFDRQNVFQVGGFSFVKEFPRFLLVLFALQRMTPDQLGRSSLFCLRRFIDAENRAVYRLQVDVPHTLRPGGHKGPGETIICEKVIRRHWGIRGRATSVLSVFSGGPTQTTDGTERSYVLKVSCPEVRRLSEPTILDRLQKIAETSSHVKGHIPEYVWSYDDERTTAWIREALGLELTKGERVLRLILFPELEHSMNILYPPEEPEPTKGGVYPERSEERQNKFIEVWWHCLLCHYDLWKAGIRHRDISVSNLMWKDDNGKTFGILNDYDLTSDIHAAAPPTGTERTGTVPFMALDLLTDKGMAGEVEHLYRHDWESFIWVLVWVCKPGWTVGSELILLRFEEWVNSGHTGCREKKLNWLTDLAPESSSTSCPAIWELAGPLTNLLYDIVHTKASASHRRGVFEEPLSSDILDQTQQLVFQHFPHLFPHNQYVFPVDDSEHTQTPGLSSSPNTP